MTTPAISVTADRARALTFNVVVRDAHGESKHRITMQPDEAQHWAKLGAKPSRCVEAAMRFLLDREPKEAILGAFDMRVIRRYFPDFDEAFPDYLARSGTEPGSGA